MSYACIDREELDRRGLCEEAPLTTIVRETVMEPILPSVEPLFETDPFVPVSWGSGRFGGSRFAGGGGWHGRGPGGRRLSGGPQRSSGGLRRAAGGGSGGSGVVRQAGTSYVASAPSSTSRRLVAKTPEYRASQTYAPAPMQVVSRGTQYQAAPPRAAAPTMTVKQPYSVAPTTYTKTLKGLGQVVDGVSPRWKWAALGLTALLGVQFWWWNKKAPQVLRLGGY